MKPSDFYIGVSEFLSILVPGFIVTTATSVSIGAISYKSINANEWAILLLASYILGHILFAIGSYWDDIYNKFKPVGNEELLDKIGQIRGEQQIQDCSSINKYKWSRSVLSILHPDGLSEVLRKESDSKLFRSLIVPLIVSAIASIIHLTVGWVVTFLALALIAFWRYREQRFKACKIAYTHIIVLYQLGRLE